MKVVEGVKLVAAICWIIMFCAWCFGGVSLPWQG